MTTTSASGLTETLTFDVNIEDPCASAVISLTGTPPGDLIIDSSQTAALSLSVTNDIDALVGGTDVCGPYSYTFSPQPSQFTGTGLSYNLVPNSANDFLVSTEITI